MGRFIPIDFVETDNGDIGVWSSDQSDKYAYATLPPSYREHPFYTHPYYASRGDIYLNEANAHSGFSMFQKGPGSHGFQSLFHELGHALGLKHSFELPACSEEDDNQSNTVMTYDFDYYQPATFMRYDIKTLQYIYGERPYNRSDDTYVFSDRLDTFVDSASQTFYDDTYSKLKNIIWDSGGIDTVDISAVDAKKPTRVDLREGGVISFSEDYREYGNQFLSGTALAYGVEIKKVVVSRADDTVYLNDASNVVR